MSRLELVFWRFWVFGKIMAHFLIVITLDLTKLICCFIQTSIFMIFFWMRLTKLSYIDSCCWGRAFLLFLLLVILTAFFLFLLPTFCEKLQVITIMLICWFLNPDLRLFYPRIFYQLGLGLSFGRKNMYWLVILVALLVKIQAGNSLYLSPCLGSDSSFD